jgi:hypothetical protein
MGSMTFVFTDVSCDVTVEASLDLDVPEVGTGAAAYTEFHATDDTGSVDGRLEYQLEREVGDLTLRLLKPKALEHSFRLLPGPKVVHGGKTFQLLGQPAEVLISDSTESRTPADR